MNLIKLWTLRRYGECVGKAVKVNLAIDERNLFENKRIDCTFVTLKLTRVLNKLNCTYQLACIIN